jgi:phage shock protein PspC (stress-responsive transcriptional regulator)
VCAGVAEYFNVDPVIVRIAAVVLAVSGPGVIAYLLAWIFVPEADPSAAHPAPVSSGRRDRGTQILGIVLLAVSVSVLWGGWWSPARRWMFPFGLMALGAWLLLRRDREDDEEHGDPGLPGTAPWDAPTSVAPVAVGDTEPTSTQADTPTLDGPSAIDADPTLVATVEGGGGSPGPPPPWDTAAWSAGPPPETPEAAASRRRRRLVFPTVMGALLLWTGVAFLTGVSVQTGLAVALCIVGLGFVLGAFVGGSWALIVPAVVLGAALVVTSVVDIPLSGPVGSRTWTPQSVSQVADRYELSVGEGILDLTDLELGRGDDIEVVASIGIGHLRVQVPAGVAVQVHARAGAGDTLLLGESNSGVGVEVDRTYGRDGTSSVAGTLHLDLEVGLGQVEVLVGSVTPDRSDPTTAPEPTTPSSVLG